MPTPRPLVFATTALLALASCDHGASKSHTTVTAAGAVEDGPSESEARGRLVGKKLTSGGRERTYLLYAPESATPLPLVVALHGRLGDGAAQDRLSHFSRIAAREKFVLALPDGYGKSWNDDRAEGPAHDADVDDVAFLNDLVDELTLHRTVDPARVYVAGMSNGGFMAESFACRSPDKVAAIAIVGALLPVNLAVCTPARTMSVMIVVGDRDPLVPYAGGGVGFRGGGGQVKSADDTAKFWASAAGCQSSVDTQLDDVDKDDGITTTLTHWETCRDGAEVSLYRVKGGGHTWPGGWQYMRPWAIGKTSRDWDASETIWKFFENKRR